jgi:O-antigen/teichoic acid export membrane protein/RNAse (barnase) inhibitor barstar
MNNIRVTYSGLISLASNLVSVFTGLIFVIIVTRTLTSEEFGVWGLISGLLAYAVIISPIVCYWSTRETARGEESGKTAVSTNSMLSLLGVTVYLIISYFVAKQSNFDESVILFAAILIPVIFLNDILIAIIRGWKTHILNYGLLSFEISKIVFVIIFVYFWDLGVIGAIFAVFVSYLPSITILFIHNIPKIKDEFNSEYVKKWFKLFWIPTYRQIPNTLLLTDVVIFSAITGSVIGVAYFTAARTIAYLVDHTRSISQAMYPKILESGKQEYLQENLMLFFFLSFPLVGLSITFSESGLYLLNPIYVIASPVVIFLSLKSFLIALNSNFFLGLQGLEKVDIDKKSTFKDYAKSKLMLHPTFQFIRSVIYFASLTIIFSLQTKHAFNIDLISLWALIGLLIELPLTLYMIHMVKKEFTLNLQWSSIIKYFITCIASFGLTYYLMQNFLIFDKEIFVFLPNILAFAIFSVVVYFLISIIIDNRAKRLVGRIISELNSN